MIKANDFESLTNKIKRANKIALFCHINPDPDTVCSAFAMKEAITKLDKEVNVFCDDEKPENLDFLIDDEPLKVDDKKYDLAIGIDSSDLQRLGSCQNIFLYAKDNAALDHHKSHSNYAKLTILDDKSSSCSEIIFKFLKYANLLDDKIVQLLFAGMIADNGCFQFSNVTQETHLIAAEMYKYNFDVDETVYNVFRRKRKNVFDLSNRVLSKASFFENGQVAIVRITKDDLDATNTNLADTSGIVSSLINVEGVEVAFAVSEVNKVSYKISVRTKRYVDANDCVSMFGGGGHVRAAGCRLSGHIEDVCDKLLKAAKDRLL